MHSWSACDSKMVRVGSSRGYARDCAPATVEEGVFFTFSSTDSDCAIDKAQLSRARLNGFSKRLLFDGNTFMDIDLSLRDIPTAYQLLDDFWVTGMQNLSQAIGTVHVDRAGVERRLGYKDILNGAILKWKVRPHHTLLFPPQNLLLTEKGGWSTYI